MNKRGQFFLIAAIVIVIIVAGLGIIYNSIKSTPEDQRVYDLSNQVNYESAQIIDNGVFYSKTQNEVADEIQNLSTSYALANPSSDLVIIYGNLTLANILYYNNTPTGEVSLSSGGLPIVLVTTSVVTLNKGQVTPTGNKITISIKGIAQDFTLQDGQNFYIILKKDKNDERIVAEK